MINETPNDTGRDLAADIAALFSPFAQVRAIALGGSRAAGVADPDSDFDMYIYTDAEIPIQSRSALAATQASYSEVGNQAWGEGDEWVLAETGHHIDVIYFGGAWMEEQLDRVLVRHEGSVGYSTCFWHTVLVSQPLYDRDGWFAALQLRSQCPYPGPLRRNIIDVNYPILGQQLASYRYQISRALSRGDAVSVNHRVAGLLASVFDVIFAVNRLPHPGEKRQEQYVRDHCRLVPSGFHEQLATILRASGSADRALQPALDSLLTNLEELLRAEELITLPGLDVST